MKNKSQPNNTSLKESGLNSWKDIIIPVCTIVTPILAIIFGWIYFAIRDTKHDIYRYIDSLEKNLGGDIKELKEDNRRLYDLLIKRK